MVIDMNKQQLPTVAQLRAFLNGTQEVQFEPTGEDSQRYAFIAAAVKRLRYARLSRADKGVVMRYLGHTTGYSRAQLKRLVRRVQVGEALTKRYTAPAQGFARKFLPTDIALLAETDALHGGLSGPATRCLMQRALDVFGDARYERLAAISVAHLYNLLPKDGAMRSAAGIGPRPTATACRSRNAGRRPRIIARASSASTPCTRAIRTG